MKIKEGSNRLLFAYMATIGIIKILLTTNLPIFANPNAGYDDALMVNLANSIADFHWLGAYSNVTLVKGPFFPFFLACCKWTGLSFLDAQTILYALGCVFFVCACDKMFKSKWTSYVLYLVMMMNPVTFSCETFQRVYRNGVVMGQELFVLGGIIAVYIRINQEIKSWVPWLLICGVGYVTMTYTRDDAIWCVPFVVVASVVIWGISAHKNGIKQYRKNIKTAIVLAIPFIMMFGVTTIISTINYAVYGIYTVTDTSGTYFAKVIKTMYSVDDDVDVPCVSVSRDKLRKLYEVSPTLASIQDTIEERMNYWEGNGHIPGDGEVEDGFFYWGLRQAVEWTGYYESAEKSETFYKSVYEEIEAALNDGTLNRRTTMPSALMSPWRSYYGEQLFEAVKTANKYVYSFDGLGIGGSNIVSSGVSDAAVENFEIVTSERAIYPDDCKLTFSGWVVVKGDEPANARIVSNDGVVCELDRVESGDVAGVDEIYEMNPQMAEMSRFATVLDGYTMESGLFLQVYSNNGEVLYQWPIDSNMTSFRNEDVALSIDVLTETHSQELYRAKADSIVDRLSKIISVYNKYGTITYVISWICFIALCAETVYKMWRKKYDTISPLLIITGMALSYLVFIIGVAYTHISAFSAISYMYLSSAYPVIIATEWLLILTETEKVISLCSKFFAKRGKKIDDNA